MRWLSDGIMEGVRSGPSGRDALWHSHDSNRPMDVDWEVRIGFFSARPMTEPWTRIWTKIDRNSRLDKPRIEEPKTWKTFEGRSTDSDLS